MPNPAPPRRILMHILKSSLRESALGEVQIADRYIDDALDALEVEEPTLERWLANDPQLTLALQTNINAIWRAIYADAERNIPFARSIKRMNILVFRMVSAAVYHGVLADRPDWRQMLPPDMKQEARELNV